MKIAALLLALLPCAVSAQTAVIHVDAGARGLPTNPRMYGIFVEEINHGIDGGLYAEMVANRAFEESRPPEGFTLRNGRYTDAGGYDPGFDHAPGSMPSWDPLAPGVPGGEVTLSTTGGLNLATPYCAHFVARSTGPGRVGLANRGWWGMGIRRDAAYNLSLWTRGAVPLLVRLEDGRGAPCSNLVRVSAAGSGWRKSTAVLRATRGEARARLAIWAAAPGEGFLDFVSLMPSDTFHGRSNGLRPDIAGMIANLHPGFVRFPGGCVVEGGTPETAYNWKLTVGPVEKRTEQWGTWGYRRTHGMGLLEYLQFCEDIKADPLWVGFDGQTCIFRNAEVVPMSKMEPVRQGFLDIMEYANGPATGKWGAVRAAAGRKQPFSLRMTEIGNENAGKEYIERFRYVRDELKARYPNLTCLADLSFCPDMPPALFDMNDEHYYNSPQWFASQFHHYDKRDRKRPPAYLGEVAVTSGEGGDLKGNLLAALGEGIFLMGCERNADVVRMVSYAPLLAHVDGRSGWHGMIYHDSTRVFGTVSYYLWQLFGANLPTVSLPTTVTTGAGPTPPIRGRIGIGTWDTSAEFKDITVTGPNGALQLPGFSDWRRDGGNWSTADGACRQSELATGFCYAGQETWSDYTLTLKARKIAGAEGFLVAFGHGGGDQFWWNIGGWGNSEHGIEFNRTPVGRRVPGKVETGRWYDIRVELQGRRIRCYLDGALVHDQLAPAPEPFFAVAGRDDRTRELVVKAINFSDSPVAARIEAPGIATATRGGTVTTLTSGSVTDNNSLERPRFVAPVTRPLSGPRALHTFPAHSLTILRVPLRAQ